MGGAAAQVSPAAGEPTAQLAYTFGPPSDPIFSLPEGTAAHTSPASLRASFCAMHVCGRVDPAGDPFMCTTQYSRSVFGSKPAHRVDQDSKQVKLEVCKEMRDLIFGQEDGVAQLNGAVY